MEARELNGTHIGRRIKWIKLQHQFSQGGHTTNEYEYESDPITMITHKKNGQVLVRHGGQNRQPMFRGNYPVEVLPDP